MATINPPVVLKSTLAPPPALKSTLHRGLPGKDGKPGAIGDAGGAFLVNNRLSEIADDPAAQVDAQSNLGLGLVDPLAYYILARN